MAKDLVSREADYAGWYNGVIKQAGLAEHSPIRGCMIIKPYGYALWERMQNILDAAFKATGHSNAYFPLFIPKSFLSKEAQHVEGFAKECAVVTHYRLKNAEDGSGVIVDPEARLEEELIVRPTSETIIWGAYKNWIQSYRDLPLLINQWANVVRWEMRTRFFLRTTEFLWQEGHTAHATEEEAREEALKMLGVYADFVEQYMAVPVIQGRKTESEKFAGAEITYTIEALMQDGKALQAGTSHFLGQNFAKAFDVKFTDKQGDLTYVWGTSWGLTTRLIGALIMTHGDDDGLIIPPKLAPIQVVIIPVYKSEQERVALASKANDIRHQLEHIGVRVHFDNRDTHKPGWKFAAYEMKGIPIRMVLGQRELLEEKVEVVRRDTKEKLTLDIKHLEGNIQSLLETIQADLYQKALEFRHKKMVEVDDFESFKRVIEKERGFVMAHWDGTSETEEAIKLATKATIRCIPHDGKEEPGVCVYSGKPSPRRVIFAESY